jgi:hypothetical protein
MFSSNCLGEALFFLEFKALLAGAYAWYIQAETSPACWFLVALFPLYQFLINLASGDRIAYLFLLLAACFASLA